ncbi:putative transcription factor TGA like domain-containing protein [Dioscorea sansibarensis]
MRPKPMPFGTRKKRVTSLSLSLCVSNGEPSLPPSSPPPLTGPPSSLSNHLFHLKSFPYKITITITITITIFTLTFSHLHTYIHTYIRCCCLMESYYPAWISRQEHLLGELLSVSRDDVTAQRALISRVLAHYHEYYTQKSRTDVLLLFSPPWLTPLERTFLWAAGWRPSLAFRLLPRAITHPLTPAQSAAVEDLRRLTATREKEVDDGLARVQEAVASTAMLRLARGERRAAAAGGGGSSSGNAAQLVLAELDALVSAADALRAETVTSLVEILSPDQTVDFLAAAATLHLQIRLKFSST